MVDGCVFCKIIAGDEPADIVGTWRDAFAFRPLHPVVEGHTLIVPTQHVRDALENPQVTARTMECAAGYAGRRHPSASIITSAGAAATQTIFHLHVHVVPRAEDDNLLIPWGMLNTQDQTAPHDCPGMWGLARDRDELLEHLGKTGQPPS